MSNGILVVDDNVRIRKLLRVLVETNTPFKVCGEAENGAEAIRMAKELRPDLVLLDFSMPGKIVGHITTLLSPKSPQAECTKPAARKVLPIHSQRPSGK